MEETLTHGSLLVMRPPTQRWWQHQLPKQLRVKKGGFLVCFFCVVAFGVVFVTQYTFALPSSRVLLESRLESRARPSILTSPGAINSVRINLTFRSMVAGRSGAGAAGDGTAASGKRKSSGKGEQGVGGRKRKRNEEEEEEEEEEEDEEEEEKEGEQRGKRVSTKQRRQP